MNHLYTTQYENIVMKSEPRHMADTVSYMLKNELCEILDWDEKDIANKQRLNENFVRIRLKHDWYEWHVISWQLEKYDASTMLPEQKDKINMDKNWLILAAYEYMQAPYLRWWRMPSWIDCSWLSQQVFAKFGVSLLRDARDQIKQWVEVAYNDLQVCDLVFFEEIPWSGKIKHVWIFIEPWKILHASEQWTANVRIDTLDPRGIINTYGEVANIFVTARRYT